MKTSRRTKNINLRAIVATRDDASRFLKDAGDAVLVRRNNPRLLVVRCPCGCGDDLLINLDRRAGPAWRSYVSKNKLTLFPSYWRDLNCESHFIIWNNRIFWCDFWDEDFWSVDEAIEKKVLSALPANGFIDYADVAEKLDLIPWEVLQACRQLEARHRVVSKRQGRSLTFRRLAKD